jgi:ribonucleoside-diphosphate reductase alpha chain
MSHSPTRQRLPKRRHGTTHSVEINGASVFMTTNEFADGRPGEVFATWGKEGSTAGGLMDAFSIVLSLALQYGVPAEVIVSKLKDMRFEPFGLTDDPDIPEATSVMDWVAQRIALDYLPTDTRATLGIFSVDEQARQLADTPSAVARLSMDSTDGVIHHTTASAVTVQ